MRILVVVHAFLPHSTGGAETYAHGHANALAARGHEITVLAREADASRADYAVRRERHGALEIVWLNNTFRVTTSFAETYANPAIDAAVAPVLDSLRPEIAHVHHLTGLSTGLVSLCRDRNVPVVFTLHDYWLICHRGQLFDEHWRVCDRPRDDACASCMGVAGAVGRPAHLMARSFRAVEARLPDQVATRLRKAAQAAVRPISRVPNTAAIASAHARTLHMREVARTISCFLAPSEAMASAFRAWGVPDERVVVWPNGHDATRFRDRDASPTPKPAGALRVGFLGSVMASKAPHLVADAVARLPPGTATVEVVGRYSAYHGDDRYRETVNRMRAMPFVTIRDAVPHDQIPHLFDSIDVLAVPSVWPENSPLVISEAFLAGVPVVASHIGGIPELVVDGLNGLLVAPGDVEGLRKNLQRLGDQPERLEALRYGARRTAVRSIVDDATAAEGLYQSWLAGKPVGWAARRLTAVVLHYGNPDETRLAVLALLASRRPIDELIVVDNDPDRRCAAVLQDLRSRLTYLPSPDNRGFAAGMNAGIRRALEGGASQVLLVNNDVTLPPDTVDRLEAVLWRGDNLGVVAPALVSRSDPGRIESLGMSYHPGTGRMRHAECGQARTRLPPGGSGVTVRVVDGVSGTVLLIRRDAWERVGPFDEGYFYAFEDLDWCLRAKRQGLGSAVVLTATALHQGGTAIAQGSPRQLYFAARGHLRLAASSGAVGRAPSVLRAASVVTLNLAHALRVRRGSLPARLRAVLSASATNSQPPAEQN